MPRVARFKIAAIEDLLRQLEYAPPETLRRQMDAAERLIGDLDPLRNYPQDYIIYRVTGYRSDRLDDPVTLVGQALLPDLVSLVQTLSEGLDLPPDCADRRGLTLDDVAVRLRVSHKTVQRYRKQGLVCHYIVFDGVKKLGCFEDALERFVTGHAAQVNKAAGFTRLEGAAAAQIIEQARRLRQSQHLSLNDAALRLAQQCGRAHETVRGLLRRHDRSAAQPIFAERGPLSEREVRVIHRAWQRGIEPARIAKRFAKTKPTIHRAINRGRRDLLRTVELSFIRLPTFELPDAAKVILSAAALTSDLGRAGEGALDVMALIHEAHGVAAPAEDLEHALVAGYNLLKMRAAAGIAALGEWPHSDDLDAIETDLRWVSLVQRRLVMLGFPAALRRIEQNLHRALLSQPAEEIVALINLGFEVAAQVVESVDPSRGQRLERLVALAMDKALAQIAAGASGRAAARHQPGSIVIDDPLAGRNVWDAWLNLRPDLRQHVPLLKEKSRLVVAWRYGLEGAAPLTVGALATRSGMSPVGVVRAIQGALRDLRAMVRQAQAR